MGSLRRESENAASTPTACGERLDRACRNRSGRIRTISIVEMGGLEPGPLTCEVKSLRNAAEVKNGAAAERCVSFDDPQTRQKTATRDEGGVTDVVVSEV